MTDMPTPTADPAALIDAAVAAYEQGRWRDALALATASLQQDDGLDECVFLQALCLRELAEPALAAELLATLVPGGPRGARFAQRAPAMAEQAAALLAGATLQAVAPAATGPRPDGHHIRLPDGHEAHSLREFIWGDQDPYRSFPCRPTDPPQKGWYSDHPVFEQLITERRPRRLLEVGSLLGGSAVHIGQLLRRHGVDGHLVCVDTFLGSCEHYMKGRGLWRRMLASGRYNFFDEFLGNVAQAGVEDRVTPFIQTSTNAARLFGQLGLRFDLIYLDASHEYADVLADLRAWYPLLAPGGVLVGDDFEEPWFEIIRAGMEFAQEIGQPLQTRKAFASSPLGGRENTKFLFHAR